ncbi:MAG: extracellular solute-binding protein [Oscillospiraceae bacterium]|nr:extracellular solute-binding protein [Oscillospiraceae bacterium]
MKRIQRSIIAFVMAFVMCVTAFGCSPQPSGQNTTAAAAASTTTQSAAAATQAATTATTAAATTTAAAAAAQETGDAWISDEPLTFTILYPDNPSFPHKNDWLLLTELKARTNVSLDFMVVPQTDFRTKQMLMLNASEWPDMYMSRGDDSEFAINGVLLPISDHMDLLPNFTRRLEERDLEADLNNLRELDGKLYSLPGIFEAGAFSAGLAIRLDLLEKYGLDVPTDFEQLYDNMKVFKENDPQSMPIIMFWGIAQVIAFMGRSWHFEILTGNDNVYYDRDTKQYEASATSPKFKSLLEYLHKTYAEGLMDPELFTVDLDQWAQKLITGRSTVTWCWGDQLPSINSPGEENTAGFKLDNVVPLKATADSPLPLQNTSYADNMFVIPSAIEKRPYFNDMMRFLDWWCYSEEGSLLGNWGVEGKTYLVENGNYVFTPELLNSPNGAPKQSQMDFGLYAYLTAYRRKDRFYEYIGPEAAVITAQMDAMNLFVASPPRAKMTIDDKEDAGMISAPIKDYVDKSIEAFVTGSMSLETDWDGYVSNIESQGIQKLVDIYNASIQ